MMIVIGLLLATSLLTKYLIFKPRPIEEVKGTNIQNQVEVTPSPIDQDTIPQGQFYAPILLYHHIALRRPQNSYYVSPEIFTKQMQWLKDNGYQVISFDQFYAATQGEGKIPSKPVVITFDDGYADQYKNAFPILKKFSYSATFFIKINNLNKGGMTWNNLKELQKTGNIIGSHSVNHNNMAKMSDKELKYELQESKQILEKNLKTEIKYFAYPGGEYSATTIEATKNVGYLAAVTTRHAVDQEIKNDNSIYTLPRIHIDDEMPTFTQWVQGKNLH